jgi:serine/threonine-protein kinase
VDLKPGDTIDRYVIEAEIGEGGMAVVYRARHTVLGSLHAVKVLHTQYVRHEEIRQRFLEEGKIQARHRHPNITPVTDIIAEREVAGLVMPLLEGEDLESFLQRTGTVAVVDAVSWTLQILSALAFVHAKGVVHRDLKPANVFIENWPNGATHVRVMDFGIAKVMEKSRTQTGVNMGTIAYMSPEQIRSPKHVDGRTDLYAVGVILYEMLTGIRPFDADAIYEMHQQILKGDYPSLRSTSVDPSGPSNGSYRVNRGGSWGNGPAGVRAGNRNGFSPAFSWLNLGLRLARS